ncbi:hypothetical protein L6452_05158 [Arctium lappa]|uniref:Uncharacterized protein n=1 Tax=Arctium lappa TaxID=4217 RepID=A0ACB9EGP2_ARCLA|nr:hypothetical protein L6452_05158 [Arctium lappa]
MTIMISYIIEYYQFVGFKMNDMHLASRFLLDDQNSSHWRDRTKIVIKKVSFLTSQAVKHKMTSSCRLYLHVDTVEERKMKPQVSGSIVMVIILLGSLVQMSSCRNIVDQKNEERIRAKFVATFQRHFHTKPELKNEEKGHFYEVSHRLVPIGQIKRPSKCEGLCHLLHVGILEWGGVGWVSPFLHFVLVTLYTCTLHSCTLLSPLHSLT